MERETLVIILIACCLASALVAFIVTYIISSSKIRNQRLKIVELATDLKAASKLLEERQKVYDKTIAELKQTHKNDLDQQIRALKSEVSVTAQNLLKTSQDELSKGNKDDLSSILDPLKESLESMKKALSDNEKNNVKTTAELKSQLESAVKEMSARTADIGAKADSLSEALTGRPKVQGCWGENLLDDILSKEGFEKGLHYDREVSGEDLSRPDFVFHFYDGMEKKDLVVDSKVSLTAFVEYMNAESDDDKKLTLDKHLRSVKKHIDELSAKNYASKIDKTRRFADYVIMFMPVDMAFRVAIDADYSLWQYAYSKGVVIATEQTIMPFMKIIRLTWNKYSQDSNVMEIMQAADAIVERVGLFYDSYKELGKKLKAVYGEYNRGIVKLEDKGPSITTSAKKLLKLGAKRSQGKELSVPEEPLMLSEEEEIGL